MHWLPKDKESKFGSNFHLCLQRSSTDRLLSFESIATQTRIPVDKVEFLVMRALAKGLVKGSIDQVEQTVNLTWVQVRYWGYLNQGLFWPATPANCKFVFLDIFFFASQFEVVFLARSFRLFICLWRDSSCETLFWLLLFAYPSFPIGKHFIKMDSELSSTAENLSWFRKLLEKCDFFCFQPRVLDKAQLRTLMGKISGLNTSIRSMEKMIENNASEIITDVWYTATRNSLSISFF